MPWSNGVCSPVLVCRVGAVVPRPKAMFSPPRPCTGEKGHYVWMNAVDGKVYCIPDGYEVVDKSLEAGYPQVPRALDVVAVGEDIKYNLNPVFR